MKRFWLLALAFAVVAAGCGNKGVTVTSDDGAKVSVNPTTGDMTVTDKEGKTTEIDRKGDSITAKSSDGSEIKVEDGKVSGVNEKGEKFESGAVAVSEAELGLPFYPGSKEMEYGSAKMDTAEGTNLSMNRTTTDTPEKVVEFYKGKFKDPQTFNSSADGATQAQVGGKLADGADAAVIALREKGGSTTQIMITIQRKKTK